MKITVQGTAAELSQFREYHVAGYGALESAGRKPKWALLFGFVLGKIRPEDPPAPIKMASTVDDITVEVEIIDDPTKKTFGKLEIGRAHV